MRASEYAARTGDPTVRKMEVRRRTRERIEAAMNCVKRVLERWFRGKKGGGLPQVC